MEAETDLLEHYTELPDEVQRVLEAYFEKDNNYETCAQLVEDLNKVGYTIDYGLDAEPYGLRKIRTINIYDQKVGVRCVSAIRCVLHERKLPIDLENVPTDFLETIKISDISKYNNIGRVSIKEFKKILIDNDLVLCTE